jgi:hypothetical protein
MSLLASVLFIASCAGPCAQERVQTQLAELVAGVRSADYRGDRGAL